MPIISANVVESSSFIAAAFLGAATNIHLISRSTHPARLFKRREEAVSWLLAQVPTSGGVAALPEFLRTLDGLEAELNAFRER
jgi:hypothetical protein